MKLLIVESPNKIKKIKTILGAGWDIAASVGHVRDLPPKDLGIEPPDYRLQYEWNERGQGVVESLKPRVARAESVFLATDPDREGEAIAWHLKETLHLTRYQRVTFDAITEDVIQKAIARPRQIDMNLVHAQEARRGVDRLVGYQVSPELSRQTGIAGLSAGRVQTVAVRYVVDRQREIEAFNVTKHFGAEAAFEDGKWRAYWDTAPFLKGDEKYILDATLAETAARCRKFRVTHAATKAARQAPPPPFTTATLLQAASVTLHFKPDQTAMLAQKLFEQGLITYHRTDSQNFSPEAIEEIREYARGLSLPLPEKQRRWKAKDTAQEAHEAIRPTHLEARQAGEDEDQRALYNLIFTRAVASQLADAEYSVNTVALESQVEGKTFLFKAVGRTLVKRGWRALTEVDAADEEESQEDDAGKVPALAVDQKLEATSTRLLHRQTQPPSRYTQASLIKKLEAEGIGRPSTYPSILKNILGRSYLAETKKQLSATDLAKLLIDSLQGRFAFVEYQYTRELERQLDEIAEGRADYQAIVSALDQKLKSEISGLRLKPQPALAGKRPSGGAPETAPPSALACPKCVQGFLRQPAGRDFFGCSRYREGCTFAINTTIAKKQLTPKQVEALVTKGCTSLLKGFTSKQGKPFDAVLLCNETTGWRTTFIFEDKAKPQAPNHQK